MEKQFVLFDFDGVIVDTFEIAAALAKRSCSLNSPERYRSLFEGNIYTQFDKSEEGHEHGPDCETTLEWWEEYRKSGAHEARPFPGVIEAVRALARDYTLAIISSGNGELFIKPALARLGLTECFADVLGAEVHTSKSKKMEMVFEAFGCTPAACVFVTDTLGDIREAAEHQMGAIACSWGFHAPETLEKGAPFRMLHDPQQLPDTVHKYFNR